MFRSAPLPLLVALVVAPLIAQDTTADREFMTRGRPLADQLRPGDKHVAILINADTPLWMAPPDGVSWERFRAEISDFVIVARADAVTGRLVYSADVAPAAANPGERSVPATEDRANWIVSSVLLHVERVIKGPPALASGDRLLLDDNGGTAMVRGVTVDAVIPWERPLEAGKRYLLFGSIHSGNRRSKVAVYEEPSPGARLSSTTTKGKQGRLETLTMGEAIDYLVREVRR